MGRIIAMLIMLSVIHNKDYIVIRIEQTWYVYVKRGLRESELRFAQFMEDRVTNWL